ncbi:hypothetical protein AMATHDRAFT_1268 [Amanita thiersii Skay4041]|uniref:Uncharacterized protein n=1 Tax=Amanita thiersii Skay4041 TaxID=703135 RepID=A0A2A9P016_9AGAR|nr:hypothetical protein AMATHDRAFT_1268 [Amanita thiersii Skay4041]
MGFTRLKVSHKSPHLNRRDPSNACSQGGFIYPTLGLSLDALKPLNITWDTSCLSVENIDIILSAPGNDKPLLQGWKSVKFSTGYRVVDLLPRKWNSTQSQQLQLSLYESDKPSFLSPLPAGPVFTATYTPPADGSVPPQADMSLEHDGNSNTIKSSTNKSIGPGKTAAAVLIPILLIILGIVAYIAVQRRRGKEKRKRWSEALDKHMSIISSDWKSMSAAGAQAAIRNSIAVNARNSSFSFGAIRPNSMAQESSVAPDMTQIRRPGTGLRNAALANSVATGERVSRVSFADTTRVSRVSFAADPRPSTESRRTVGSTRASRAYHNTYLPPVPSLPPAYNSTSTKISSSDDVDASLSPRQTVGPLTLTPEDIRARIQGGKVGKDEDGIDEVLPALSMMRTGSRLSANPFANSAAGSSIGSTPIEEEDEYLIPSVGAASRSGIITMPEPTHFPASASPAPSFPLPMLPHSGADVPPSNPMTPPNRIAALPGSDAVMSPDAMLRAYAERKASSRPTSANGHRGLEKQPSFSNNGFVGGFAISLSKKGRKKEKEAKLNNITVSSPMPISGMSIVYPIDESSEATMSGSMDSIHGIAKSTTHHARTDSVGVGAYGGAKYAIGDDDDEQGDIGRAYGGTE